MLNLGCACFGSFGAMRCKAGSCKNDKETTGCQYNFETMSCRNDGYQCYKEQQQPYSDDEGNEFDFPCKIKRCCVIL